MNNLENASKNFLEMVQCVQKGEAVQYRGITDGKWYDGYYDDKRPYLSVQELSESLTLEWRKKPDAFEEVWEYCLSRGLSSFGDDEVLARYIWNAAMEQKK